MVQVILIYKKKGATTHTPLNKSKFSHNALEGMATYSTNDSPISSKLKSSIKKKGAAVVKPKQLNLRLLTQIAPLLHKNVA